MRVSVAETLKWIRETHPIAEKPAENLPTEIREAENPSLLPVMTNISEFSTQGARNDA